MFVGHFAVAFGAKRAAPKVSLGTLFLAAQFLDLLWPTFVVLGIETVRIAPGITAVTPLEFVSYPWSHSLAAALVWGALFGGVYWRLRRRRLDGVLLGFAVVSHWLLDFATHRPDLQLWPGSARRVGLGLWFSLPATLAVELTLFLAGLWIYARATRGRDRAGEVGFVVLVGFLLVAYGAAIFGPPPPSVAALGWGSHSVWLLVAWGYWLDRHRAAA